MRIGIDLGGTKIEAALMDDSGKIIDVRRIATPTGDYPATLQAITELTDQIEQSLSSPANVGIATPGSISRKTGKMKNCNSTCLNGESLLEDLQQALNRQVRIANDADCFTLSESTDGSAMGIERVFGVILGTGVGGGICQDGKLLAGPNAIAGEWGHNALPPLTGEWRSYVNEGRDCYCGRMDCIETYLSGVGFERGYRKVAHESLNAAEIVQRSKQGDQVAQNHFSLYQERLACALGSVINLLDPQVIVLGGGMSNVAGLYEEVPRRWLKYVFSDTCETRLLAPKWGDSSGVRGAAWLWPS